jgi:hypothetical protein
VRAFEIGAALWAESHPLKKERIMASQPLSIPAPQAERVEKYVSTRTIPMRTVVAVFSALLILFAWLHFVLALQIASTNQQIYDERQALAKQERENAIILLRIAEAESPRNLEQRAILAQYEPQKPRYLMVKQTLDADATDTALDATAVSPSATDLQTASVQDQSLADVLAERLSTWLHIEVGP